jgi:hypothetical protein
MIKYENSYQQKLDLFKTEFEEKLNPKSKWVTLAGLVPWDQLAEAYYASMSSDLGRPGINARIIIGSMIIKHFKNLSDEDTILEIQENPYLQYFLGLETYSYEPVFAPSLFVEIRRRLGDKFFEVFNQAIVKASQPKVQDNSSKKDGKSSGDKDSDQTPSKSESNSADLPNSGSLLMDATVAEQQIAYPTDLNLLNNSREICEEIITIMHAKSGSQTKRPRTKSQLARKDYLSVSKQKRASKKNMRKAIKKQLQYLSRCINFINGYLKNNPALIDELTNRLKERWLTILKVYDQQKLMYDEKSHRCEKRIVSLSQPHVRPIVRGKAGKNVEFGSKICMSMNANGLSFVDKISWENCNESLELIEQVKQFKVKYGYYPEKVHADQIYGTKLNRAFLKENNIRYIGKPLGRQKTNQTAKEIKEKKKEYAVRNRVEGKFGEGKNKYRLGKIRAKTKETSEAWIKTIFMVMNLAVLLRNFFVEIFKTSLIYTVFLTLLKKTLQPQVKFKNFQKLCATF